MEMKMSYLRGFTANDYYSGAGLFRGGLPNGFAVSLLYRDPFEEESVPTYLGQFQVAGPGVRGWAMFAERDVSDMEVSFVYGDGTDTEVIASGTIINTPFSQRTVLLTWFFGIEFGGKSPALACFVNGTLMELQGAASLALATGYTPADANNAFTLGRVPGFAAGGPAGGAGISGFAFQDAAPAGEDLAEALDACALIARTQWEQVEAGEDLISTINWAHVYSVRRGLRGNPQPTWPSTIGVPATALTRQGNASLFVEAAKPRFWSGSWVSAAPPVP